MTVTADLSDATTGGSTVTQAELVVDDAVTVGVGLRLADDREPSARST